MKNGLKRISVDLHPDVYQEMEEQRMKSETRNRWIEEAIIREVLRRRGKSV